MTVLVRGLGNVGTTLANVLLAHREALAIDRVVVMKERPEPWLEADLDLLEARGAEVVRGLGDGAREALESAAYVLDCRKEGAALADRERYAALPSLRAACAQGSEVGLGPPFVAGVNGAAVAGERFVQIASCNTHALVTILRALCGARWDAIESADFVVVRRSEDLGSRGRLVGASVVARHRDERSGTHHAVDALRVLATIGASPRLVSSDVTTPSELMHAVRFAATLRDPLSRDAAARAFADDPFLATTEKLDSNRVFELGRRYGFQGRLYVHAVVVAHDLLVHDRTVAGWAFVPQEGNTILSTVEAFVRQTGRPLEAALAVRRALHVPCL